MNKIVALTVVAGALASASAFGQGYIDLQSSRSAVNDVFTTPGTGAYDTKVDVALMISSSTSATPVVEALSNGGTATSGTAGFSIATAWTDIQNDPNFTEAIDGTVSAGTPIVMTTSTKGVAQYNGGSSFGLQGTSSTGSYSFYEVSWNGALYATLSAAEAAGGSGNDPIGWSQVLNNFALGATSTAVPMPAPTFAAFGTLTSVPEPGTMALAGLGGLSLLAFRRKK